MQPNRETAIQCPYCGESIEVFIDESAGTQTYYEDCQVCCAPILFVVNESPDRQIDVQVFRDDE
jgi:hypothetical protein